MGRIRLGILTILFLLRPLNPLLATNHPEEIGVREDIDDPLLAMFSEIGADNAVSRVYK